MVLEQLDFHLKDNRYKLLFYTHHKTDSDMWVLKLSIQNTQKLLKFISKKTNNSIKSGQNIWIDTSPK